MKKTVSVGSKECKKKKKHGITWHISIIVMVELVVSVLLVAVSSYLLEKYLGTIWEIQPIWMVVGVAVIIIGAVSIFINHALLSPIRRLGEAMNQVADGNYKVKVDAKTRFGDIEDIYQNFSLMTKELASTEILKTDFISNVSHEIKTPINAIEGYAMLLQGEEALTEEQIEYVEKILVNTQRLSELVGNTLLLSKIDNQSIETRQESYRLDEQIRQSILLLELKWSKKDIDMDLELQSVQYTGNKALMMHVWNNLIGNAIKFTPANSKISIRLEENEGRIIFSVDDEGQGIKDDAQRHIFDKFYQADSSHKQEGNGLGLALAKSIVDTVGGNIRCENLTKGCRFTVELMSK